MGRPVVAPLFGDRLKTEREKRKLSMGQVASRIHRQTQALDGFTSAQLLRYEAGQVGMPDPVALLALSALYDLDVLILLKLLREDREMAEQPVESAPRKKAVGESPPGRSLPVRGRSARS